jgi:hypothetical protein
VTNNEAVSLLSSSVSVIAGSVSLFFSHFRAATGLNVQILDVEMINIFLDDCSRSKLPSRIR